VCSSLSSNPSAFHFLCRSILLWFCGRHWFSRARVFLPIHFLSATIFLVCSESFLLWSASAGIFVYAARVLCAGPFFITKVSCSRIHVPTSRSAESFVDLYFPFDYRLSYSYNRSKHLVDSVRSSVSVDNRPSLIIFPAQFAPARRRLCLLSSARLWFSSAQNPFPILS
jgi:hypothetical protein